MMRVTTSEGDHIDTVIDKKGDSETQVKSGENCNLCKKWKCRWAKNVLGVGGCEGDFPLDLSRQQAAKSKK